jgi:hypothetical protein
MTTNTAPNMNYLINDLLTIRSRGSDREDTTSLSKRRALVTMPWPSFSCREPRAAFYSAWVRR